MKISNMTIYVSSLYAKSLEGKLPIYVSLRSDIASTHISKETIIAFKLLGVLNTLNAV